MSKDDDFDWLKRMVALEDGLGEFPPGGASGGVVAKGRRLTAERKEPMTAPTDDEILAAAKDYLKARAQENKATAKCDAARGPYHAAMTKMASADPGDVTVDDVCAYQTACKAYQSAMTCEARAEEQSRITIAALDYLAERMVESEPSPVPTEQPRQVRRAVWPPRDVAAPGELYMCSQRGERAVPVSAPSPKAAALKWWAEKRVSGGLDRRVEVQHPTPPGCLIRSQTFRILGGSDNLDAVEIKGG